MISNIPISQVVTNTLQKARARFDPRLIEQEPFSIEYKGMLFLLLSLVGALGILENDARDAMRVAAREPIFDPFMQREKFTELLDNLNTHGPDFAVKWVRESHRDKPVLVKP